MTWLLLPETVSAGTSTGRGLALLLITFLTGILAAATALPFVPWPHGLVRVCDFPRLQIAALALPLAAATLLLGGGGTWPAILLAAQAAIVAVQLANCVRFTPLHRVQSLDHDGPADGPDVLCILSANVKMSNRRYDELVALARQRKPDILIVMEIDAGWMEALAPLREEMPHTVEWPSDNSYGMALFSRLPLADPELRFLVVDQVPSIRTMVRLRTGDPVRLYAVHPEPPVPYEDTVGRDGELVLVAREAKADPLPVIVTGDLNDVAWSRSTQRFQRLAGLLDPRVGRGFFNTFDARFAFLRWPLDHLFHSAHFRLVSIERLPFIGSDHFPILFALALHERPRAGEEPGRPDGDDREEARDLAADAAALDREPIGSDWEK